ncbi:hypothetical protein COU17_01110 [Candidatus Kaiserbacteria bacterium CG10_big_fil_rev_8_21_14_0_10_49_17]|uniref:Uncharacterized protein n=1 Tax=Candidatus Kaiserbacteria bacterium CG10_big_fil_rev_8_21_14_0_10_49_17 TaxID=1974609 RepID=A0A2M6WF29_9BACT|nr:MAG: hypothetical protein COU17_01110 [Candidatus Kaiserbacteria bacterium CG10_big_fil_rev_8_21_14_0_10_49_17]
MKGNIQFNDQRNYQVSYNNSGPTGITGKLISLGIARDKRHAQLLLSIVGVGALLIMGGVFLFSGNNGYEPTQKEVEEAFMQTQQLPVRR